MKLSRHAFARSQQRGISREVINLIDKYGTRTHRPGNALAYHIPRKRLSGMSQELARLRRNLERCNGVILIASPNGEVITVEHKR